MDKDSASNLFVNDGSFMERFKQNQQGKQDKELSREEPRSSTSNSSVPPRTNTYLSKKPLDFKSNDVKKPNISTSGGKLAFSLKQKSKIAVAPVKLGADEDELEEGAENGSSDVSFKRQKLGQPDVSGTLSRHGDVGNFCFSLESIHVPSPPSDPAVRNVADKLASFVAKNGRQFEHVTRQRNPGDTPFKFLFDSSCKDYKYYEYRLLEEEKLVAQQKESQGLHTGIASPGSSKTSSASRRTLSQNSNYQTPASALYDEDSSGEASGASASDPIAMMEFYMKKAAQEERKRQPKQSKDEMPPPASLQAVKKGHHMGDFIPQEELEKFLSTCNDASAQKVAREATERAKIQADNVGHRLLSKMGWKEGEGLGSSKSGRADPVMAGDVKRDNLGVGAFKPGEVNPDDDIYEQYKKRMMLGYRYRPNPLNNPRKAYY